MAAGPVEATALGNIGMQILASRTVGDIEQVRDLIAQSFATRVHMPREQTKWEQNYPRFQRLCESYELQ